MPPPAIVYINLDRANDRRAFMERQAASLNLALERFPAVSAEDIETSRFDRLASTWERPLSRVELALFLSHRSLWERAACCDNGLVVLEDDAVLSPAFPEVVAGLAERAGRDGLANLEWFGKRKFMAARMGPLRDGYAVTPVRRDKAGTAGYYVGPLAAARLVERAAARAAPSDAFLYATPGLRFAQLEPAPVAQVESLAILGIDPGFTTTTSIHTARRSVGWGPGAWRFRARRLGTDLRLAPLHARRLLDTHLREPAIDRSAFEKVAADLRADYARSATGDEGAARVPVHKLS